MKNIEIRKMEAIEFFSSLSYSIPLRDKVDLVVDHMRDKYGKSLSERIIFDMIKEEIHGHQLPAIDSEIFVGIMKEKLSNLKFDSNNSGRKIINILHEADLFNTDGYNNQFTIINCGEYVKYGRNIGEKECKNDGWLSRFAAKGGALNNHFPFHSEYQLENPVSRKKIVEISKCVLSENEYKILDRFLRDFKTYKRALIKAEKIVNVDRKSISKFYDDKKLRNLSLLFTIIPGILFAIFVMGVLSQDSDQGKSKIEKQADEVCVIVNGMECD